jgi:hypothetical protein
MSSMGYLGLTLLAYIPIQFLYMMTSEAYANYGSKIQGSKIALFYLHYNSYFGKKQINFIKCSN